jgi:hypothetical protein
MKYEAYDNQLDDRRDVELIEAPNAIVALAVYMDNGPDYVIDKIGNDGGIAAGASYKDKYGDPIYVNADGINNDWQFRCEIAE